MVSIDQRGSFVRNVNRFGQKPSSVVGSFHTIWPVTQVLPDYININSAQYVQVAGVNATDTASGTGMRAIRLTGVVSGFAEATEDVWLNGTTPNTTANQYLRVNRAFGIFCGSNDTNAGSIFIGYGTWTGGVPDSVLAQISAGLGQTTQLTISLPADVEAHFHSLVLRTGQTGGGQANLASFRIRSRTLEAFVNSNQIEPGPWRVRWLEDTIDEAGITLEQDAIIINGPADVIVEANGSQAGARLSGNLTYEIHRDFGGRDRG